MSEMDRLGEEINALEFDTVFRIEDGQVVTVDNLYAPTVMHDPTADVEIDGDWECLTGMTGQYGYNGAVMHPSEYIGRGIAQVLSEQDEGTVFAIVTVDAYPDDEGRRDGERGMGHRLPKHLQ